MTVRLRSIHGFVLLSAVLLTSCLPSLRRNVPATALARRLVLALDGVDYRDVMAARSRGLFAGFKEPSRLISTFPSISDIAWHEIFRVQPPRGYQRIYYSAGYNDVIGAPLDAIRPIEFEDRMDMAFGAKFHHLGAYLISNTIARREVDVAVRDFFTISGRSTIYVYNVGPDALQHTRGDLERYLQHLDRQLSALETEYLRRTGQPLEIVVLSDHGHNRAVDAKFLPVVKALEARGFRAAERLRSPTDVAFSVDGVTTGFGVFAAPDSLVALSHLLAGVEGVDMVSLRVSDTSFVVRNLSQHARIDRRMGMRGDRYRYVPLDGDPLRYGPLVERMKREGVLDGDGFADGPTWVRYSATADFPAALVRIVRGHTVVTLNPAPILVSIADAYRVGLGMVSIANRMRPLGGTHGALSNTNSLGVLMTNFRETRDDLTTSVSDQFGGFADLNGVRIKSSGARLTSAWLIGRDQRSPLFGFGDASANGKGREALEMWITPKQLDWAEGRGILFVDVRRARRDNRASALVGTSYLPMPEPAAPSLVTDGWAAAPDRLHYVLPLSRVLVASLEPDTEYDVRIVLDRLSASGRDSRVTSKAIATITVRTDAKGEVWPY
ncbi:MAG: hypothetical protein ABMA00_13020 [Gemmatimonas sp.]